MNKIFGSKIIWSILPIAICSVLFVFFMGASTFFIQNLINPFSKAPIQISIRPFDFAVGFFLYFVTAVDYALIVGRMQIANPGLSKRLAMNVFTCIGCFVGVSSILFLWGLAKEVTGLIIFLLILAGSVMIKLAYESLDFFAHSPAIWQPLRTLTVQSVTLLQQLTHGLTFWIPELGSPRVVKMSLTKLATWSFLLPFIIGLDDFVGYMGAMTIYNAYSLLAGIYFADVLIDVLIFTSPAITKKIVQSAVLSFLASLAFLYLMYKSYSEVFLLITRLPSETMRLTYSLAILALCLYLLGHWRQRSRPT